MEEGRSPFALARTGPFVRQLLFQLADLHVQAVDPIISLVEKGLPLGNRVGPPGSDGGMLSDPYFDLTLSHVESGLDGRTDGQHHRCGDGPDEC